MPFIYAPVAYPANPNAEFKTFPPVSTILLPT